MQTALIVLGVVVVLGGVLLAAVLYMGGSAAEAHGRALYSSVGAWTRIREFARERGDAGYIAEADKTVALLERDLAQWREMGLECAKDLAPFEKLRAEAYAQTDQNIRNGQNPLAYLDAAGE